MERGPGLHLLLLLALSLGCCAQQVSWDVVNKTTDPVLNAMPKNHVNPYSEEAQTCKDPGTCVPYKTYVPNQNVFYWCGWKTTYRTRYTVKVEDKSVDSNITTTLMRQEDLDGCNLTKFSGCRRVAFSTCGPKSSCSIQANGLVFSRDLCLLIAVNGNATVNSGRTGANVEFQLYNYYESPRYYGTVFTIIYTILLCGGILVYMTWACYHEYNAPNDRIHEFRTLENALQAGDLTGENEKDDVVVQEERKAKNLSNFSDKVTDALSKLKLKFRRRGTINSPEA